MKRGVKSPFLFLYMKEKDIVSVITRVKVNINNPSGSIIGIHLMNLAYDVAAKYYKDKFGV